MTADGEHHFHIGALRIDLREYTLTYDTCVKISPKCMSVLHLLIQANGRVVSRDYFLNEVWSERFGADESLSKAVSELRKAFKSVVGGAEKAIVTVPKSGYRLDLTQLESMFPTAHGQVDVQERPEADSAYVAKILRRPGLILSSLLMLTALIYSFSSTDSHTPENPARLLVLPQQYEFARPTTASGITEGDLITLFSATDIFDVEPLSSTEYFQGKSVTPDDVASHLEVDYILQWRPSQVDAEQYLNLLLYKVADKSVIWQATVPDKHTGLSAFIEQNLSALVSELSASLSVKPLTINPDVFILKEKVQRLLAESAKTLSVEYIDEAIELLASAPQYIKSNPLILLQYSRCYLYKSRVGYIDRDEESALAAFSTFIAKAEEAGAPLADVAYLKALFYLPYPTISERFSNKELAAFYFDQARLSGMSDAEFYDNYSYFLISQEQYDIAKVLLEEATQAHPLSYGLLMNYFAVNYRLGNQSVLTELMAKAEKLFPGYPLEHAKMLLHMMNGEAGKALQAVSNAPVNTANNIHTALMIYAQFNRRYLKSMTAHLIELTETLPQPSVNSTFRFLLAYQQQDFLQLYAILNELDKTTLQSIYSYDRLVMQAVIALPDKLQSAHVLDLAHSSGMRQMNSRSFIEVRGLAALYDAAYQKRYSSAQTIVNLQNTIKLLESMKEKEHGHYHTLAEIYAYTGEYEKALIHLKTIAANRILPSLGRYYQFTKSPFFSLDQYDSAAFLDYPGVRKTISLIESIYEEEGEKLSLWLPESLL